MLIKDKEFEAYIGRDELKAIVERLAAEINRDYAGRKLLLCPVLTGACIFAADLMRRLTVECEVNFVRFTSYSGMASTGSVKCELPFPKGMEGKEVLIVEDVVDSGLSMARMREAAMAMNPKSLKICTLFFKPHAFGGDYKVDYVGREIGDDFIVGYGMDYDELGRNLGEVMRHREEREAK